MKKRVLFLMSDTGGGHRAAAEAIMDALESQHPGALVMTMVDVFREYTPFPYKYMPEFYPWLINNSKSSWGVGYKLSNTRGRAKALSRGMYAYSESGLKQMTRDHPADLVVCVHSVLTRPCIEAYAKLDVRPPFVVVVTDLVSTHMFWYDRRAELTLVPTQPAYNRGLKAGIAPEQMHITGLPVHPKFAESLTDKASARAALGWDPQLPAILIVGGGDGLGPLYKTARAINARNLKCQIAVIAGRNKPLKEKLGESDWNQPTHIYGFVTNMPVLMAASNILVTKAGPATLSEACIAGLPSIIYDAIPGQETGNVEWVVNNEAGIFAPTAREVADAVEHWLSSGGAVLRQRQKAATRLATPNAVWEIADYIWEYAQHPPVVNARHRRRLPDLARFNAAAAIYRSGAEYLTPFMRLRERRGPRRRFLRAFSRGKRE